MIDRFNPARYVNDHVDIDHLEIIHWFVCWFSYSCTIVILVLYFLCSVVADVTDTSIRNTWLSRLDGIVSAAFIIGPAVGAVLMKVNNRFPLLVLSYVFIIDTSLVLFLVLLCLLLCFS